MPFELEDPKTGKTRTIPPKDRPEMSESEIVTWPFAGRIVSWNNISTEFHLDENNLPVGGSRWRHHSGVTYVVLFCANVEPERQDTFPTMVIYQNANGKRYARPVARWLPRMTPVP